MRTQIVNYTFDKTAKTVTFADYGSIRLDEILIIENVTRGASLYNFVDPTTVGTVGTVATNVLTLNAGIDTSAMNNADKLLIYYDDPAAGAIGTSADAAVTSDVNGTTTGFLRGLVKMISNVWDSGNTALRIIMAGFIAGENRALDVLGTVRKYVVSGAYSPSYSNIMGTSVAVSLKATEGNIVSVVATNANASVRYFQIFNKTSAPATSDVPVLSIPISAGTAAVPGMLKLGPNELGENGMYQPTGLAYGVSTTNATFTAATSSDHNEFVGWN